MTTITTQPASHPVTFAGMTGRAVTVAVVVIALAAALPLVLSNYQVGLATEILIFGVLAMSIDILAGFAGRTSLGHGAIFGVSTYVVVYATAQAGLSPATAFALGVVACIFYALALMLAPTRALIQTFRPIFIVDGYVRYRPPDAESPVDSNGYVAVLTEDSSVACEWPTIGDVALRSVTIPSLAEFSEYGGVHP